MLPRDRSHLYTKPQDVKGCWKGFSHLPRTLVYLCCLPSYLRTPRQSRLFGSCPSGNGFTKLPRTLLPALSPSRKNAIKKSPCDFFIYQYREYIVYRENQVAIWTKFCNTSINRRSNPHYNRSLAYLDPLELFGCCMY